jgi:hypothetical protein
MNRYSLEIPEVFTLHSKGVPSDIYLKKLNFYLFIELCVKSIRSFLKKYRRKKALVRETYEGLP